MAHTPLLLLSLLGIILCCFFPIQFYFNLLDPDIEFNEKISSLFISVGCIFGILLFISTTIVSCCFNKGGKICTIIGSILVLLIGGFFIVLSQTMMKQNDFSEDINGLHNIELKSNCCGWKSINLDGCYAKNITDSIKSCYDEIGYPIQLIFIHLFVFYMCYVIYIFITLLLIICSSTSSSSNKQNLQRTEYSNNENLKED
ncbi:hypothetical protein KM1_146820 [Entamoeba histolytica HM-3:IMSS]|uniref:Tetraspanin family protein n=1 Tax=Entamoeba histolytica HM-3:IMSS TaxID=885315 RepID=M7WZ26_ENTHI|nr:hypothetical protein KM1_146820 [Entamoeba histolytica HM-3:IMSS]